VILARDATLTLDEAFSALASTAGGATTALTLDEVEGQHILRVLQETHGRIEGPRGAAVRLGLHPSTLRARLRQLDITRPLHG
jgi:formate hydrogenlyase transcriptional activator